MYVRKAENNELDLIYSMGFDAWSDGLSIHEYVDVCRASKKYQLGVWYVLISDVGPVSSLIVYLNQFGLKERCFGIGSIATIPEFRRKGYGAKLLNLMKNELLSNHNAQAIYLHSDIDREYYSKLGFISLKDTNCMVYSNELSVFESLLPEYF